MKHLIAGLTSLFPVLGMVSPQPVGKGDIAAVTRVLTDYYNAFSTLDVQAILPYYHEPSLRRGRRDAHACRTGGYVHACYGRTPGKRICRE